jgi:hypothetical protein
MPTSDRFEEVVFHLQNRDQRDSTSQCSSVPEPEHYRAEHGRLRVLGALDERTRRPWSKDDRER